ANSAPSRGFSGMNLPIGGLECAKPTKATRGCLGGSSLRHPLAEIFLDNLFLKPYTKPTASRSSPCAFEDPAGGVVLRMQFFNQVLVYPEGGGQNDQEFSDETSWPCSVSRPGVVLVLRDFRCGATTRAQ